MGRILDLEPDSEIVLVWAAWPHHRMENQDCKETKAKENVFKAEDGYSMGQGFHMWDEVKE